mgnify:FL=1
MIEKLCNLYIKHKTKNFTRIPLFIMKFDWKKFQKDGKKDSCILNIHPDIANDQFVREKLSECVDYIRDNYNMEIFTKI